MLQPLNYLAHRIFIQNLTSFQESQDDRNFFFKHWNSFCQSQIETDYQEKDADYKNEGDDIDADGTVVKDGVINTTISDIRSDIKICADLVVSHHFKDFLNFLSERFFQVN